MVQPKYNPQEALEKIKLMMKYDLSKTLNENKVTISEQYSDLEVNLQKYISGDCIQNGKIVEMNNPTNENRRFAIKLESTITPGKFKYFFIDGTVSLKEPGKNLVNMGYWDKKFCDAKITKSELEKVKSQGKWLERSEISDTEENINNPKMYETKIINGVTLYRKTYEKGVSGKQTTTSSGTVTIDLSGFDDKQKKVIQDRLDNNWKLPTQLSVDEKKTWTCLIVSSKDEGIFSEDLIMCKQPDNIGISNIVDTIEKVKKDQDLPKKACKSAINLYYAFATGQSGYQLNQSQFENLKDVVTRCISQHNKFTNWFGGDTETQKNIEILKGERTSPKGDFGDQSPWRIKIKRG